MKLRNQSDVMVSAPGVFIVALAFVFLLWIPLPNFEARAEMTPAQRQLVQAARDSNHHTRQEVGQLRKSLANSKDDVTQYDAEAKVWQDTAQQVVKERDEDAAGWTRSVAQEKITAGKLSTSERHNRMLWAVLVAEGAFAFLLIIKPWRASWFVIPYVGIALWAVFGAGAISSVLLWFL